MPAYSNARRWIINREKNNVAHKGGDIPEDADDDDITSCDDEGRALGRVRCEVRRKAASG
jgi:hypothetical protein